MKSNGLKCVLAGVFLLGLCISVVSGASPMTGAVEWQKTLGGSDYEFLTNIEPTGDGGYIFAADTKSSGSDYNHLTNYQPTSDVAYNIAADTKSNNSGDIKGANHGSNDFWVVKLKGDGSIAWQKLIGGKGEDIPYSIRQTSDGGYILAGSTYNSDNTGNVGPGKGSIDTFVVKLDGTGNIQWRRSYGGTFWDTAVDIRQTSDGGYIFVGETMSSNTGDVGTNHNSSFVFDVWAVKLTPTGNITWQKVLGGNKSDRGRSIQQTTDGGYILSAVTYSDNNGDVGSNHDPTGTTADYWVVKLDNTGTVTWQKMLGGSRQEFDWGGEIQQTTDGGYILAGGTESSDGDLAGTISHGNEDYWIVKLGTTGSIVWQKRRGGSGDEWATSIQQTSDGGYIVGGTTFSSDYDVGSTSHGSGDAWVLKLDSAGSTQWSKVIGADSDDRLAYIRQMNDGDYIFSGHTWSNNNGDVGKNHGQTDVWVVKLVDPNPVYNYVQTTVLAGNPANLPVSASLKPVPAKTEVHTWNQKDTFTTPDTPGWLFFVDDNPDANWEHPARYIFANVTKDRSVHTSYPAWSPPSNILMSPVAGVPADPYGANALGGGGTDSTVMATTGIPPAGSCTPNGSSNYALLIAGGYDKYNNHIRYYNDIKSMYDTLNRTYNYPRDHIWVLVSDGIDPGEDQHYADTKTAPITPLFRNSPTAQDFLGSTIGNATNTTVKNTLASIRNKLKPTDNLFIFTTNHGGSTTNPVSDKALLYLWGGDSMTDAEFVSALPTGINSITITMEQCFSGGFINEFISSAGTQKRVIATAANWNEYSWGNAFSYPWIRGVANPVPSDSTSDGRASMNEAFVYAKNNDPYAAPNNAKETPQFFTANIDGTTQFLAGCSAVPKIEVTSPTAGENWHMANSHTITWIQTGLPSGTVVNIELRKGTSETLVNSIPPVTMTNALQQSTSWTIPTVTAGPDYIIKIVTTDGKVTGKSSKFSLKTAAINGSIRVTTSPVKGARIFLDSVDQGPVNVTDYTFPLKSIYPGSHTINVTLKDYYPIGSGVNVVGGMTALVPLQLDQVAPNDCAPFGKIIVRSSPVQDAKVLIDGKYKGANTNAEIGIAPGTYQVTVEHEGYATPAAQTVTIGRCGQERTEYAYFELQPQTPVFPTTIISAMIIIVFLSTVLSFGSRRER